MCLFSLDKVKGNFYINVCFSCVYYSNIVYKLMLFKLSPVKTHTSTSLFDTLTQHYRTTYSIY